MLPHTLQENVRPASADGARKRKVISPGKSGPASKRAAGGATTTAAAPSGRQLLAAAPPAEENIWEAVAQETGWTPADCLGHKVAFAKRAADKAKVLFLLCCMLAGL